VLCLVIGIDLGLVMAIAKFRVIVMFRVCVALGKV
jgi:hypothetical protein